MQPQHILPVLPQVLFFFFFIFLCNYDFHKQTKKQLQHTSSCFDLHYRLQSLQQHTIQGGFKGNATGPDVSQPKHKEASGLESLRPVLKACAGSKITHSHWQWLRSHSDSFMKQHTVALAPEIFLFL